MPASKPVQRTIEYYKKMGAIIGTVERYNSFVGAMIKGKPVECPECHTKVETFKPAGIRQDLFGFADLLVFFPDGHDVALVQCGAATDHSDHKKKILANDTAREWVRGSHRILILISWGQYVPRNEDNSFKKDGKGKRLPKAWTPRLEAFTIADYGEDPF